MPRERHRSLSACVWPSWSFAVGRKRVCGSCGATQGPFARYYFGTEKTGQYLFTCPLPVKDDEGKLVSDAKRRDAALNCTKRREAQLGAA